MRYSRKTLWCTVWLKGKVTFTRVISAYYFIDESMEKIMCTFKRLDYKKSAKYKELKKRMKFESFAWKRQK